MVLIFNEKKGFIVSLLVTKMFDEVGILKKFFVSRPDIGEIIVVQITTENGSLLPLEPVSNGSLKNIKNVDKLSSMNLHVTDLDMSVNRI